MREVADMNAAQLEALLNEDENTSLDFKSQQYRLSTDEEKRRANKGHPRVCERLAASRSGNSRWR